MTNLDENIENIDNQVRNILTNYEGQHILFMRVVW